MPPYPLKSFDTLKIQDILELFDGRSDVLRKDVKVDLRKVIRASEIEDSCRDFLGETPAAGQPATPKKERKPRGTAVKAEAPPADNPPAETKTETDAPGA